MEGESDVVDDPFGFESAEDPASPADGDMPDNGPLPPEDTGEDPLADEEEDPF